MKLISLTLAVLALIPATSALASPPEHSKAHGHHKKHHNKKHSKVVTHKVYVHDSRNYRRGRYLRDDDYRQGQVVERHRDGLVTIRIDGHLLRVLEGTRQIVDVLARR